MTTDTQNNTDSSASDSTNNQVGSENQNDNVVEKPVEGQTDSESTESTSNEDTENKNKGPESEDEKSDKSKSEKDSKDEKPEDEKDEKDEKDDKDDEEEVDRDYSKLAFKDPENIDQDLLKEATEVFGEAELSVEQAQKLVQLQEKFIEKNSARYYETVDGWIKEAKKDPEFGGKDFDKNMAVVNKAFKAYGSDSLGKFLDDYRFGDHPEVIRMFYRIGLTVKEDSKAGAGIGKKPSSDGKTLAERMYPNSPSSGQF